MPEPLHLDQLIGAPPEIIRTNRNGHGAMNKHDIFASKKEKQRGVQPGGRRRKKSRKKKKRKKSTGRSGKKKTRKKTATVHKFEIVKRNPLTIKIFEKKGKKWVLIETHVSQKGGVITRSHKNDYKTRQKQRQIEFFKKKRSEGMAMHDIQREWINIVKGEAKKIREERKRPGGKRKRTRKRRGGDFNKNILISLVSQFVDEKVDETKTIVISEITKTKINNMIKNVNKNNYDYNKIKTLYNTYEKDYNTGIPTKREKKLAERRFIGELIDLELDVKEKLKNGTYTLGPQGTFAMSLMGDVHKGGKRKTKRKKRRRRKKTRRQIGCNKY